MQSTFARLLAATAAVLALAGPVQAAAYNVSLTGAIADGIYDNILGSDVYYLKLSAITPFTVVQGDTVHVTISLDGVLNVRGSTQSLLCVDIEHGCSFSDPAFDPPPGPLGSDNSILVSNSFGPTGLLGDILANGCSCITALVIAPSNTPYAFDGLVADILITELPAPYTVDAISLSYQLEPIRTPEPAALALLGLGAISLAFARRSRAS